jgi:hypothetical protein
MAFCAGHQGESVPRAVAGGVPKWEARSLPLTVLIQRDEKSAEFKASIFGLTIEPQFKVD